VPYLELAPSLLFRGHFRQPPKGVSTFRPKSPPQNLQTPSGRHSDDLHDKIGSSRFG